MSIGLNVFKMAEKWYRTVGVFGNGKKTYEKADCFIVCANNGNTVGHKERCDQSEYFLLPRSMWNELALGGGDFFPEMNDYVKDTMCFNWLTSHGLASPYLSIWRHKSIPGSDGTVSINAKDINNIPNWYPKMMDLKNQYFRYGSFYSSFRAYVLSLAVGDDVKNFWGWLFDNRALNKYTLNELPRPYRELFNLFLRQCFG